MAQPEKRFRCGACEVSIFKNVLNTKDGRKVTTKKASFQKRYKTTDGEWKTTNTLDPNDIPKAKLVLDEAYKYRSLDKDIDEKGDKHNHIE
jgi:hypothetical protein